MPKISDFLNDFDLLVGKYSIVSKLEEENKVLKRKLAWNRSCFERVLTYLDEEDKKYFSLLYLHYFE